MPWMKALSDHYRKMKDSYPEENLMLVFDIDDTIVDIRLPLLYVLKKYDFQHGTSYFKDFTLKSIVFEEWGIQNWLPGFLTDQQVVDSIVAFVRNQMWQEGTILLSHRPFLGVLETIRWFQIQKDTTIGLNTGRSDTLREVTLRSLNILGKEYRISFPDELLYMNPLPNEDDKDITSYKVNGIKYFQNMGYKVIAFIDNEPANLKAVADGLNDQDIILLHADTMFGSSRQLRPQQAVVGDFYEITDVIDPETLPHHVEFVWNGVNRLSILEAYIKSNVFWAEVDARRHPLDGKVVCKHSSFDAPDFDREEMVSFDDMIARLAPLSRGIKIVLKENGMLLEEVINILKSHHVSSGLWFDITFEVFTDEGLKQIRDSFPDAVVSTRVDFLVPLLSQFPDYVDNILKELSKQGINQYSVSLQTYNKEAFLNKMEEWGHDVNIRDVYSFESFLRAMILLPKSVISTFNY